jgi:hypothetical protein
MFADSDSVAIICSAPDTVHTLPILISIEDGSLHVNHAGKIVSLDSLKHRIEKLPQYKDRKDKV